VRTGIALVAAPGVVVSAGALLNDSWHVQVVAASSILVILFVAWLAFRGHGWVVILYCLSLAARLALFGWVACGTDAPAPAMPPRTSITFGLDALGVILLLRRDARAWFRACRDMRRGVVDGPSAS
jgi:hypothetical protein